MKRLMMVCALILCMVLTGCNMLLSKSRDSLTRWVADNREAWEKIVSTHQPSGSIRVDQGLADQWSRLFRDGHLRDVYWNTETGDYHLYFNGITEPLEGDQYLIWSKRPMEDIAPQFAGDPGMLEEKNETRLYWTGVGAGSRGYILVERVDDNWYYVEYNYPT